MKIIKNLKGSPEAASLTIAVKYVNSDIKKALVEICASSTGIDVGVSLKNLTAKFYEIATDSHMPDASRLYIAKWMARRAVKEGFVFRANDYIGFESSGEDIYLIDVEFVRSKMRGFCNKKKK